MKRSAAKYLAIPLVGLALFAGACGSDSTSSSSDTTSAPTTTAATATPVTIKTSDVARAQTYLDEVGCWAGTIDNTMGPETEAAIKAFQQAKGLTVDGRLSTATMTALQQAAAEGKKVCEASAGSTTTSTTTPTACAEVTDSKVDAAAEAAYASPTSDFTVEHWYCATDSAGKAWVGGWGNASAKTGNEPAITVNFILDSTADGLASYDMANCTNPPVPASLLSWCESS